MAEKSGGSKEPLVDILDRDVFLREVHVHGLGRTKADFLQRHLTKLYAAHNLRELLFAGQEASSSLKSYDIFSDIDFSLDEMSSYPMEDNRVNVKVDLQVKEKSSVYGNVGTKVGNSEASLEGALNIRNVFGHAEHLEIILASGTKTTGAFNVLFSKPMGTDASTLWQVAAYKNHDQLQSTRSCDEIIQGARVNIQKQGFDFSHVLSYICDWREICSIPKRLPFASHATAGHSIKSSIKYSYSLRRLDDTVIPQSGVLCQSDIELAGLGGDARFLRFEHRFIRAFALPYAASFSSSLHAGLLWHKKQSYSTDRFFLGGPTSVRGFQLHGIGPRPATKAALGGDGLLAFGLNLFFPLYFTKEWQDKPIKGHLFLNGGTLASGGESVVETACSLLRTPRLAAGLGLVVKLNIARLEMNYALPLLKAPFDEPKRGFQFGVGIYFL